MEITHHNLRLAQVTADHPPERLIEIIQNRAGNVPKDEREDALVELIRRFQYLIRKVCNTLFYAYELGPKYNTDPADFMQETLTEFIDLTINDFKFKLNMTDTGLAVFGTYIKVKLYRRVQYKLQERLRKSGYDKSISADVEDACDGELPRSRGRTSSSVQTIGFHNEIRQAIVANALHYDDKVLNHMTDTECGVVLDELNGIANDVLDSRDRKVWELYYLSGMMVGEIGKHVSSKLSGDAKTIGRSRVLQIARDSNDRIVREFGRRAAIRRVGL